MKIKVKLYRHKSEFKSYLLLVFFTVISCSNCNASVTDSLFTVYSKQKDKLSKIEVLNKIYTYYENNDKPDSSLFIAERVLQLTNNTNNLQIATAHYKKGKALFNLRKLEPAKVEFFKAISIGKKDNSKKIMAKAYNFLGKVSSWENNYNKAIEYQKISCELFLEINDLKNAINSNNQIAFLYEKQGQYDKALTYYKKNIKYRKEIESKSVVISSLREIAELYAKLHNYKQAYSYLLEAIDYAKLNNEKQALADVYVTIGKLFLDVKLNTDIALDYFLEAKKIFSESYQKYDLLSLNYYIGDTYFEKGNDSLALNYYRNVLDNVDKNEYHYISYANYKIGMVYKKNKQFGQALRYFLPSINKRCRKCPETSIHNTLIETADIYTKISDYQNAIILLKWAKNMAEKAHLNYELVVSDEALAKYYEATNMKDSAIFYYSIGLERAKRTGLPENTINIATSLSKLYYLKSDFKKSADLMMLANRTNDNLKEINKSDEVARLEMKLEVEKNKEKRKLETLASQNKIQRQKVIIGSTIAVIILFVIIALILLKAYRNKKKDNLLLARQKKEIEEMAHQLHETDKNKLQFFTNISHEIRTPLTLIKLPLEKLISDTENDHKNINSQLKTVHNNTLKLQQIVNQILDLQKLDENQLKLNLSSFEFISFLKEIAKSFEPYCLQTKCKLSFSSNISAANVYLDNAKLYSIVNNLLSNAFKYNIENGEVRFVVEILSSQIKLIISDTGRGIASEYLNKLGTRYYQVDSHNLTEGSGIGLAYVKELLELMNGKLEISSQINVGTTFSLSLPCNEIEMLDNIPDSFEIKPFENVFHKVNDLLTDTDSQKFNRILIIEDNHELKTFIHDIFKSTYQVICAKDGNDGKDMAMKYDPDVIISDIMMPGILGNELCMLLKNDIRTSHIPVILLTAKDARESQVNGYECGADDYIIKPFDTELLVHKVKNILTTRRNIRKQFGFADIENKINPNFSELDRKLLNACMKLVQQNLDNTDFTVESLSDEIGLSRKTLLRKFKVLTGKSPAEFIKHTRMSQAATLLRDKKLRVNEVAYMVGYEDTDRFSSAFKQFHGVAPSSYN